MAVLLAAEDVARAAYLQVAHRQHEPAAQLLALHDGVQALHGDVRHLAVAVVSEVRRGEAVAPAYPAAELVHLTEPEGVRIDDDHVVCARYVYAVLYYRGGYEHVRLPFRELADDLLGALGRHLTVHHAHFQLGQQFAHFGGKIVYPAHSVIYYI